MVVGAVREWEGTAAGEVVTRQKESGVEKIEKGEKEVIETTKESRQKEAKVVETTNAVKTTPTSTAAVTTRTRRIMDGEAAAPSYRSCMCCGCRVGRCWRMDVLE